MSNEINFFIDDNYFLSNYSDSDFFFFNNKYSNAEAAFQSMKCELESDRLPFFSPCPPNKAKKLGRNVKLRSDWEKIKRDVMYKVVEAKFYQNPALMEKLLATGDALLIEGNNWHDNDWGDCYCNNCRNIRGKNLLGRILMEIRTKYKNS